MHMSRSITAWFSLFSLTNLLFIWSQVSGNYISFRFIACKSHRVKFIIIALTVNILSWNYAKSIHFTLSRFLKLGLLYLHYSLHLLIKRAIPCEKPVCSIIGSVWLVSFESRLSVVVMGCIMVDLWEIQFHYYTWISQYIAHDSLVDCMAWLGWFKMLTLYCVEKLLLNYFWYIA